MEITIKNNRVYINGQWTFDLPFLETIREQGEDTVESILFLLHNLDFIKSLLEKEDSKLSKKILKEVSNL